MTTKTEEHPHRKPRVHKEPGGVKSGVTKGDAKVVAKSYTFPTPVLLAYHAWHSGDEGASGDGRHLGREHQHGQVS